MWTAASSTEITLDFTDTVRLERVEVVMFNCPQLGIGVHNTAVFENMLNVGSMNSEDLISCEHLVGTCVMASFASPTVTLRFTLLANSYWFYLAEVRFHTDSSGFPPDTTVTGATTTTTTITTTTTVTTAMLTHSTDDRSTTVYPLNTGNPGSETTLNTMQVPTAEIEVPEQEYTFTITL